MEQETKHKTKKAMAIAGIATLSAFALIGLFAIGSLIGGCADKKQADAPASEQVQAARHLGRVGADEAPDPSIDLLAGADWLHVSWNLSSALVVSPNVNSNVAFLTLPKGYYRFTYERMGDVYSCDTVFQEACVEADALQTDVNILPSFAPTNVYGSNAGPVGSFYTTYLTLQEGRYCFFGLRNCSLYLVDTLSAPASAVVTLPDDWNPTAWVSDEAIGGYPVVHGSYTTEANASGAYVRVGWSNVVFKTASDSAVFTSLVVRYRWLWNGQKYRINDQTLTYAYSSEMALLYPVSVSYQDPLTNTWTIVAKEAQDVVGGDYVHTGKLNWLYPTYRTLGFLDYPENPTSPTIRFYHSGEAGSGEATWQPTPTLQGLSFFDWFGLASWNSPQQVDVGTGNAIGLISTAFNGMVPILGISIFPNITLGLLLFLPLIGGIIVLIIKAVSK